MTYKLKLDIFEGPLDLLLYLIKKDDLNICDIPIAQITDQYMEYIELMKLLDLEVVGDFLVMAATLMHIKSKMLLPPDPSELPEEKDPRDELVRRLQEYKMFKEVSEHLRTCEQERQDLFVRKVDEAQRREIEEDSKEVYYEVSLFDLISSFTKALRRFREETVYEVRQEDYTVEQKIHEILHRLLDQPRVLLTDLFSRARSKLEVIVAFMAVLELIRLKEIRAMQKRHFEEIEVIRNTDNVLPVEPSDAILPEGDSLTLFPEQNIPAPSLTSEPVDGANSPTSPALNEVPAVDSSPGTDLLSPASEI